MSQTPAGSVPEATTPEATAPRPARYTAVAIALHWAIAAGILFQLGLGLAMVQFEDALTPDTLFRAYQLHKSAGITILLLVLVRVAWRVVHAPPPLPAALPPVERRAAGAAHLLLYGFMLAMPLTGWAVVSASVYNIPTVLFGIIPWPHLPVLATLSDKAPVENAFKLVHGILGFSLMAVLTLHVAAALRHHVVKRDDVLWRMAPLGRRPTLDRT